MPPRLFDEAGHGFAALGIEVPRARSSTFPAMMTHKQETVDAGMCRAFGFLLKKNKVEAHLRHSGTISGRRVKVQVTAEDGAKTQVLETKNDRHRRRVRGECRAAAPASAIDERAIVSVQPVRSNLARCRASWW